MFNNSRDGEVNRLGTQGHPGSRWHSHKTKNNGNRTITTAAILAVLFVIAFFALSLNISYVASAESSDTTGKLLNGGFESFDDSRFAAGKSYIQVIPAGTDYWRTTAHEKKMELLKENTGVYISGKKVKPRDGKIAAELNADEESSLYQVIDTEPSSLYEWGISHAARVKKDTMAIIIGPNQEVAPSKNVGSNTTVTGQKYGRDQMMQMVTWLKSMGTIGSNFEVGIANEGRPIILYSKKFGEQGSFKDNADNQPFSMTPSKVYTERWYIWVITDKMEIDSETNSLKWGDYGSCAEGASEVLDPNAYYVYPVPSGQKETLFAFTSVETEPANAGVAPNPTFGNFLDGVNFKLYRSLSGSTTTNGSATIESSNGATSGEGASAGYEVTSDNGVKTYVEDGADLTIKATVSAADSAEVSFAGVYVTVNNSSGGGSTKEFIPLTPEGWTTKPAEDGSITYTRTISGVKSAIDLHFVFVRSPRVTYDSNGGKPYDCKQTVKADPTDPANVYSFKPITGENGAISYIEPYTSHAAEGQNDAWKFTGWMLFDNKQSYETLYPAEHKVAFNQDTVTTSNSKFVVIDGKDGFQEPTMTEFGISWGTDESVTRLYDKAAPGLSFVAQWRWRQTFIPKTDDGGGYAASDAGGTVSVTSASGTDDPNYNTSWTENGAKAYYAEKNEKVTVKAEAKPGYYFNGWYDEGGNQVTLNDTLTFVEPKEGIKTYYAHFVKEYTQHYIRQIEEGGIWTDLDDDDATKVALLDHAELHDAKGSVVTSTAANNSKYSLVGWYDSSGNKVPDSMLINLGKTIRYTVTGDATYYARFAPTKKVYFKLQYVNADGTLSSPVSSDKSYGKLIPYYAYGAVGTDVSSKAYPEAGYQLLGWYDGLDESASLCEGYIDPTDSRVINPKVTSEDETTYYARIRARTDTKYIVEHHFRNWDNATNGSYKKVVTNTYYGTTGETVTPSLLDLTSKDEYKGYRYESGLESKTINSAGTTVFTIKYIKDSTELRYLPNEPRDSAVNGSVESQNGYVGYDVIVKDNAFTITGYTFNGWNTKADGSGTSYSKGDAYTLLADVDGEKPNVLYAQWVKTDASAKYTVEHYKLDSEGVAKRVASEELAGKIGETVTAKEKTFDGYTYKSDLSEYSGKIQENGSLVLKLYYTPNEDTLTYDANGGSPTKVVRNGVVGQVMTVESGSTLFSRPGYTFTGWITSGGTKYIDSSYTLTASDDILIAQWVANKNTEYRIRHYKVSADGMSATMEKEETATGETGKTKSASPISIPGYEYNANFDSNGMKTVSSGIIAGDGSLVLNLYYIPKPAKLIYNSNFGSVKQTEVSGSMGGNVLIAGSLFTRPGYKFEGWNTKADGSGESKNPGETYTFEKDEDTLYAQWSFDTSQCIDTMYFQKVWIDSDGKLQDYNKTSASTSADVITAESIKTTIQVSNDGGATWNMLEKRYTSTGEEQSVSDSEMNITKAASQLFKDVSVADAKVQWILPVFKENWYLPRYDDNGKELKYRIVEDESSLPEGWKQYTGEVNYSSSGATFINPVTGNTQSVDFFSYGESHKIKKQDSQMNFFIINYDTRKPASLTVNKIDGDNSTELNKVPVEGAYFELYEKSESGDTYIDYGGSVIACKKVGDERQTTLAGGGTAAQCTFAETLERGHEYYLVETKAPTGYRMLDEPVKIEVSSAGETARIDGVEKHIISDVLSIELANYLTLEMPTSGMSMTGRRYIITGLAIMIISLVLLVSRKHRAKIIDNKGGER